VIVLVILVNSQTKVVVQGITGKEGSFHTKQMLEYGTNVVAGVTPGKGGTKFLDSIPVYDTVKQAVSEKDANTSIIFVPAPFAKDAMLESINAGLKLVITITEHIPPLDTWKAVSHAKRKGVTLIGPNCPGVISPGLAKVGIMPARVFIKGNVGVVSRSGTLTYEVAYRLTQSGIGQSTVVGIGGDPIVGTTFTQILELFERDQDTKAVVMIGEIGGDAEERAAEYIGANMSKPVVAYIAGVTAPQGKRMGHAGAIISGTEGTAQAKIDALKSVGVKVASVPNEIPKLVKEALSR
jgi:succinyl-CoA synthetase alpha subunit